MRFKNSALTYAFSLFLFYLVFSPLFVVAGPDEFSVSKVVGEVLYILDEQAPRQVNNGDKLSGGKLVIMEDSSAEVIFPKGKTFPVPANTLLMLDPKLETLENSCAAVGGIREPSVMFICPSKGQKLAAGKPFELIVAIKKSEIDPVTTLCLAEVAVSDLKAENPKNLLEFPAHEKKERKSGILNYVVYRKNIPTGPSILKACNLVILDISRKPGAIIGKAIGIKVQKE